MVKLRERDLNDIFQRGYRVPRPEPIAQDAALPRKAKRGETLPGVHPNAGITASYRKKLQRLVEEMARSFEHWTKAAYRADPPRMAMDATPAKELQRAVADLASRWQRRFDEAAPELARYFARSARNRSDAALKDILRRGGFSVEFKMTRAMRDILDATIEQNVQLIRSIPEQYLTSVQGAVMRSVQVGRDVGSLAKELERSYGVTKRRAAFIALDQNQKATSSMQKARQIEVAGDQAEAIWQHSMGGKEPRPTHVGNSGKRYKVAEGWYDPDPRVRRRIWPGELVNCFPGDTKISLETLPSRLWRTPFKGPMVHIKVGADLLKGTANHPILTGRGWIALDEINCGDDVVCMASNRLDVVDHDKHRPETTFAQLFESLAVERGYVSLDGRRFDFHGHVPQGEVDEIVVINDDLPPTVGERLLQNRADLSLAESDLMIRRFGVRGGSHVPASFGSGLGGDGLVREFREPHETGITATAHETVLNQDATNGGGAVARGAEAQRDGGGPMPVPIQRNNLVGQSEPIAAMIDLDAERSELFAQFVRIAANSESRIFEFGSALYERRSVIDKRIGNFSGHVFTMQTRSGYYSVGDARIQAKNCRCVPRLVVKGFS